MHQFLTIFQFMLICDKTLPILNEVRTNLVLMPSNNKHTKFLTPSQHTQKRDLLFQSVMLVKLHTWLREIKSKFLILQINIVITFTFYLQIIL